MRNPTRIILLLCVLGVAAWLLLFGTHHSTTLPLPGTANQSEPAIPPASAVIEKNPAATPPALELHPPGTPLKAPSSPSPNNPLSASPATPEFTRLPPGTVLENMRKAFRNYLSTFGSNPVGTNPEITQALDGGNRRQTHFVAEEDGLRINARGELVDSWGTPYFFHQLSGTEMEIHSAGPDRILWTSDDLVSK